MLQPAHGVAKSQTWLSDWTELIGRKLFPSRFLRWHNNYIGIKQINRRKSVNLILYIWKSHKNIRYSPTVRLLRFACPPELRKAMTNLDCILKSRDITLLTKIHPVKAMVLSCSHVSMWELDHKEGWELKNWCFQTVLLGKTLESPLDIKDIKLVNPKGNQPWIFVGRTDAEAPILWPLDDLMLRTVSLEKTLMAGKYWGQDEKQMTENEMVAWHHWLNGRECEQTLGVSEGQGSLVCYSPCGHKEWDMT